MGIIHKFKFTHSYSLGANLTPITTTSSDLLCPVNCFLDILYKENHRRLFMMLLSKH